MDELALRQLNGGEDEDEALRRALALSMGEADEAPEASDGADVDNGPGARSRDHVRSLSDATTASTVSTTSLTPPLPKQASNASPSRASDDPTKRSAAPTALAEVTVTSSPTATSTAAPAMSLLNLDRKAMEAERLARRQKALETQQAQSTAMSEAGETGAQEGPLAKEEHHLAQSWKLHLSPKKRKAEDDIIVIDDDDDDVQESDNKEGTKGNDDQTKQTRHANAPAARRRKIDSEKSEEGTSARALASSHAPESSKVRSASLSAMAGSTASSTHLLFAKGAVKKTCVRGQTRRDDDMTIEEIWQKNTLELAVLSSFQWDEDWIMSRLDMHRTRVMLIAYAVDDHQKEQMKANSRGSNIRFCFPPMQTMGYMHSKLQLLKFPSHLRIVVPTGNLVPYDWGETGTLENMVFLIDLPKLPKGSSIEGTGTPFMEDLSYFLTAQGVDAAMVQSLRSYDFTETARYAFVHSIAGSHMDESWKRTGYSGLGRAVKAMGWTSNNPIQVDYISASVGSISDDLLNALYYACQGDSGLKELELRTNKPRGAKGKSVATSSAAPANPTSPKNCLRLYFPSQETVENSLGGRNNAGTICFQKKWWDAPTFPHTILRDIQSVRKGVLLHTKLLLVRMGSSTQGNQPGQAARPRGWAYVGSANMSESAWGRIVKDRATGKTKMTCRNWECGVLIPASDESDRDQLSSATMVEDTKMFDIFRNVLPVPISTPGIKYSVSSSTGEKRRPWFFSEA